ncbi:MAG: AAA family ATPase [Thermoleophilia bacterium]|nr:AAA family ATPase [Thermoleophilia bacterium]
MAICGHCGTPTPDDARYCPACGAAVAVAQGPPPSTFSRKTVTALFADVTSSTELGERLDPETLRRLLFRYFDEMRAILERHGGTVEKYAGDAVLAIFGVPVVHEDDALRAVRAAREMHETLRTLNAELEQAWGVRLEARIGVNTGEVVTSDSPDGTITTGDPINVAARLQQAAEPGETLLGKETYRLVSHAIEAGPLQALPVKGKRKPVEPWRLEKVVSGAPRVLRQESPLVGRGRERERLEDAFRRTVAERSCRLVTVVGNAGLGKSRLVQETIARLPPDVSVAHGYCVAYGDGITFWPLRGIVRALTATGPDDDAQAVHAALGRLLAGRDDADRIVAAVSSAIGLTGTNARSEDVFWAVRKLLETVAADRPLVLVLEDLQWADPTLLDLLEYLVGWVRDVPILLLCLTRPDLLDARPSWATGSVAVEVLTVDPLGQPEARELVANLLESDDVPPEVAAVVMDAAEGNPLFVEELLRMLLEDGTLRRQEGGWELAGEIGRLNLPPTINALLAARLDRLPPAERDLVQRAAVVGKQFSWSAVAHLAPPGSAADVGRHLQALVRRRLVDPDDAVRAADEDVFRFTHILVRDTAYGSLPKQQRAELHERYADWLELQIGSRVSEYEEILGFHLEQAHDARADLGLADGATGRLAVRAAELFVSAGRRALARGDMPTSADLLRRATVLLRNDDARRLEIAPELAIALMETGETAQAESVLAHAVTAAEALSDERSAMHARVVDADLRFRTDPALAVELAHRVGGEAVATFARLGNELGLARAWRILAQTHRERRRWGAAQEFLERALVHAERAGDPLEIGRIRGRLAGALYNGPVPVEEAIAQCERLRAAARDDRSLEASVTLVLAGLYAMDMQFERARELAAAARAVFEDLGAVHWLANVRWMCGIVELRAGDVRAAEEQLRWVREAFVTSGDRRRELEVAYELAEVLVRRGAYEEAERLFPLTAESAGRGNIRTEIVGLRVRARLLAARGSFDEAEPLARRAIRRSEETDELALQGAAWLTLADVLADAGRPREAAEAAENAVELYERKGNLAGAARARTLVGAIAAAR